MGKTFSRLPASGDERSLQKPTVNSKTHWVVHAIGFDDYAKLHDLKYACRDAAEIARAAVESRLSADVTCSLHVSEDQIAPTTTRMHRVEQELERFHVSWSPLLNPSFLKMKNHILQSIEKLLPGSALLLPICGHGASPEVDNFTSEYLLYVLDSSRKVTPFNLREFLLWALEALKKEGVTVLVLWLSCRGTCDDAMVYEEVRDCAQDPDRVGQQNNIIFCSISRHGEMVDDTPLAGMAAAYVLQKYQPPDIQAFLSNFRREVKWISIGHLKADYPEHLPDLDMFDRRDTVPDRVMEETDLAALRDTLFLECSLYQAVFGELADGGPKVYDKTRSVLRDIARLCREKHAALVADWQTDWTMSEARHSEEIRDFLQELPVRSPEDQPNNASALCVPYEYRSILAKLIREHPDHADKWKVKVKELMKAWTCHFTNEDFGDSLCGECQAYSQHALRLVHKDLRDNLHEQLVREIHSYLELGSDDESGGADLAADCWQKYWTRTYSGRSSFWIIFVFTRELSQTQLKTFQQAVAACVAKTGWELNCPTLKGIWRPTVHAPPGLRALVNYAEKLQGQDSPRQCLHLNADTFQLLVANHIKATPESEGSEVKDAEPSKQSIHPWQINVSEDGMGKRGKSWLKGTLRLRFVRMDDWRSLPWTAESLRTELDAMDPERSVEFAGVAFLLRELSWREGDLCMEAGSWTQKLLQVIRQLSIKSARAVFTTVLEQVLAGYEWLPRPYGQDVRPSPRQSGEVQRDHMERTYPRHIGVGEATPACVIMKTDGKEMPSFTASPKWKAIMGELDSSISCLGSGKFRDAAWHATNAEQILDSFWDVLFPRGIDDMSLRTITELRRCLVRAFWHMNDATSGLLAVERFRARTFVCSCAVRHPVLEQIKRRKMDLIQGVVDKMHGAILYYSQLTDNEVCLWVLRRHCGILDWLKLDAPSKLWPPYTRRRVSKRSCEKYIYYQKFVEPVARLIAADTELCVSCDDHLLELNFLTLRNPASEQYMSDLYGIGFAISLATLDASAEMPPDCPGKCLGVCVGQNDYSDRCPSLQHAKYEAEQVAKAWRRSMQVLEIEGPSVQSACEALSKASFAHLAVQSGPGKLHLRDGSLSTDLILKLPMQSAIFVGMLTCQAATDDVLRAFMIAGVSTMLAAHGQVADDPGLASWFCEFYELWLGRALPPHRALQTLVARTLRGNSTRMKYLIHQAQFKLIGAWPRPRLPDMKVSWPPKTWSRRYCFFRGFNMLQAKKFAWFRSWFQGDWWWCRSITDLFGGLCQTLCVGDLVRGLCQWEDDGRRWLPQELNQLGPRFLLVLARCIEDLRPCRYQDGLALVAHEQLQVFHLHGPGSFAELTPDLAFDNDSRQNCWTFAFPEGEGIAEIVQVAVVWEVLAN